MAEIKSEAVSDFIWESVADLAPESTHLIISFLLNHFKLFPVGY